MKILLPLSLLAVGACNDHGSVPAPFGVPITGGTMLVSKDGKRAVVADADRDRIVTVDLVTGTTINDLALDLGDEPGRLIEDSRGNVHVALRRGGAVVTVGTDGQLLLKRFACTEPRGIAHDSGTDLLHVACAGGELVSFTAESGAAPVRSLRLERDLRDVLVQGANLVVTKFRTAEILTVDPAGNIVNRAFPPTVKRFDNGFGGGLEDAPPAPPEDGTGTTTGFDAAASTAWKTIALNDGRIVMTHQRKTKETLDTEQTGGYGGGCGEAPVEDAVTMIRPGQAPVAVGQIGRGALPVDIAVSPNNDKLALVVAGSRNVKVVSISALETPDTDECRPPDPPKCEEGEAPTPGGPPNDGPGMGGGSEPGGGGCCTDNDGDGQCDDSPRLGPPTSVSWTPNGDLVTFFPEGPALTVQAGGTSIPRIIKLPGAAAFDPGRNVFHAQTAIGLACASCHPEGRDDGLTWNFAQFGVRRTQSIAGHILERAPYHWAGDMNDLPKLMDDVFSTRMAGGFLTDNQKAALGPWMNRIPAPPPMVVNGEAALRGAALFESSGCKSCHNGDVLSNNQLVNVGTGGKFKVPSLLGVGSRAPFMHDGCAKTLMDRFVTCGGGDSHGATSALTQEQLTDLVEYLDSL
ncbi:MAG: cytochrome-c peroxidase [Deltaproteobacteria bacterium]|nr:cytochrome-c peroxidase [Deltaproteobacteria bacterium]